tara:strand:- start:1338 stop:2240 length:903 start_codon:yes stop_codon:yes gene_type:complete
VKNIFITGGLGQDGQILTKLLQNRKINLNLFAKKKSVTIKKTNIIYNNLLSRKKIDHIFSKNKPDIVLHLASNNPSFHQKSYKLFYKDNYVATKNIFLSTFQSNNKAKFIFCSSSQIFQKKNGVVNEKSKTKITSDYTKFRINCDNMMLKYKKLKNINYTNAILFNHDSKFRNDKFILPRVIKALINKEIIFLNKIIKKNIYSDFSHAEDICFALCKLIQNNDNIDKIILSSNKKTSLNNIIKYLIKKNNLGINIIDCKKKVTKCLIGNNKLAKKKLNWLPNKNIFLAANDIYKTKLLGL